MCKCRARVTSNDTSLNFCLTLEIKICKLRKDNNGILQYFFIHSIKHKQYITKMIFYMTINDKRAIALLSVTSRSTLMLFY